MSEQMNKTGLLDAMRTGYTALEKTLAPLDEAQMTTPGVNGTWSIKDNIAHIALPGSISCWIASTQLRVTRRPPLMAQI
jgi:hypothetical protein